MKKQKIDRLRNKLGKELKTKEFIPFITATQITKASKALSFDRCKTAKNLKLQNSRDVSYIRDWKQGFSSKFVGLPTDLPHLKKLFRCTNDSGVTIISSNDQTNAFNCKKEQCIDRILPYTVDEDHSWTSPTGRQEALRLKEWFKSMSDDYLKGLNQGNTDPQHAEVIVGMCGKELVRQISVACAERGQILRSIFKINKKLLHNQRCNFENIIKEKTEHWGNERNKTKIAFRNKEIAMEEEHRKLIGSTEILQSDVHDLEKQLKIQTKRADEWSRRYIEQENIWKNKYFRALRSFRKAKGFGILNKIVSTFKYREDRLFSHMKLREDNLSSTLNAKQENRSSILKLAGEDCRSTAKLADEDFRSTVKFADEDFRSTLKIPEEKTTTHKKLKPSHRSKSLLISRDKSFDLNTDSSKEISKEEEEDYLSILEEIEGINVENEPTEVHVCKSYCEKYTQTGEDEEVESDDSADSDIINEILSLEILTSRPSEIESVGIDDEEDDEDEEIIMDPQPEDAEDSEDLYLETEEKEEELNIKTGENTNQVSLLRDKTHDSKALEPQNSHRSFMPKLKLQVIQNTTESNVEDISGTSDFLKSTFNRSNTARLHILHREYTEMTPRRAEYPENKFRKTERRLTRLRTSPWKSLDVFVEKKIKSVAKNAKFSRRMINKFISYFYGLAQIANSSLASIVFQEFNKKYILKKVCERQLLSFVGSLVKYFEFKRPSVFLRFLGIAHFFNEENFDKRTFKYYLKCLKTLRNSKIGIVSVNDYADRQICPTNRAIELARDQCNFFGKSIQNRVIGQIEKMAVSDPKKINPSGVVDQEAVLLIFATLYEKYVNILKETTHIIFDILNCEAKDYISEKEFSVFLKVVNSKATLDGKSKDEYSFDDVVDILEERKIVSLYIVKGYLKRLSKDNGDPDFRALKDLIHKIDDQEEFEFWRIKINDAMDSLHDKSSEINWWSWKIFKSAIEGYLQPFH